MGAELGERWGATGGGCRQTGSGRTWGVGRPSEEDAQTLLANDARGRASVRIASYGHTPSGHGRGCWFVR